jgi:Tol biopolymer transport system component
VRSALLAAGAVAAAVLAAPAAQASFPGKNGLILFDRYQGSKPGIYVIASDRTRLRRLVPTIARSFGAFTPVWSPDGSSIAYLDWQRQADTPTIDVIAGVGGGNRPRVVVSGTSASTLGHPDWTSDGTLSWQTSGQDGGTCVQVQGEAQPRFCTARSLDAGSWSSTGRYAGVDSARSKIALVNQSGAETTVTTIYGRQFDWSPDGRRFVFAADGTHGVELAVVNANGSRKRLLSVQGSQPAWSPDGKWIAYNDGKGLAIVRSDGSHLVQLTSNPGAEDPNWQPC